MIKNVCPWSKVTGIDRGGGLVLYLYIIYFSFCTIKTPQTLAHTQCCWYGVGPSARWLGEDG